MSIKHNITSFCVQQVVAFEEEVQEVQRMAQRCETFPTTGALPDIPNVHKWSCQAPPKRSLAYISLYSLKIVFFFSNEAI